jgi:hypothetical protein
VSDETTRSYLHRSIQASVREDRDDELEGAVLMGWLVIAEWMHPSGYRWLSKLTANAQGDRDCPDWQWQGYAHNALHDWPEAEDDD